MKGFRRTALVTALTALCLSAVPATAASARGTCWTSRTQERSFASAMNAARTARGMGSLKLDPELSRVARVHTKHMVERSKIFHTSDDALARRVTNWVSLGENVGVGHTVTSLHTAFMGSPTHRENILRERFNHVGVGTMQAGGRLWVTVVFEAQTDPGTILAMPSC